VPAGDVAPKNVRNSSSVSQEICLDGIEKKENQVISLLKSYSWSDLKNMKTIKQKSR
jgi:hypothetical protein